MVSGLYTIPSHKFGSPPLKNILCDSSWFIVNLIVYRYENNNLRKFDEVLILVNIIPIINKYSFYWFYN